MAESGQLAHQLTNRGDQDLGADEVADARDVVCQGTVILEPGRDLADDAPCTGDRRGRHEVQEIQAPAATSASIASTSAASRTARRNFRAACTPMLTWSSIPADVGIECTDAG